MNTALCTPLIPQSEFTRILNAALKPCERVLLFADMCRCNTLSIVKRAGSGHLGSSFSAMDLVAWLYLERLNVAALGLHNPNRDIYFSSKGHDVPGLYSVLHALRVIPHERFLNLRRLGGLDGHPDISVPGIEANSGSLGMGISKGRGMAWAKMSLKLNGSVFVLLGDGELQEGQIWEALQAVVHQRICNLTLIIDCNKVQSDKLVCEIMDLRDLQHKFESFGFRVSRINGHEPEQMEKAFAPGNSARPHVVIADTIKGRGVSFMEHPRALCENNGYYRWHAGAPSDEDYCRAFEEVRVRVNEKLRLYGLQSLVTIDVALEATGKENLQGEPVGAGKVMGVKTEAEYLADVYGEALLDWGKREPNLVVLDGDLAADCRVRAFELKFPERFIENGIAEQDLVSMAGGLARFGMLPVVNSFASFLAARANEQIYNNATEGSKVIYVLHYAGLIPAGPGKSHQSIRDISLLSALPNCLIIQPCNGDETRRALAYAVKEADCSVALRLNIGPSPRAIQLPGQYQWRVGEGAILCEGEDGIAFAYGPVMLHETLLAAETLRENGFGLRVVNLPWLNRINRRWLESVIGSRRKVFVIEDHSERGGLGEVLIRTLSELSHSGAGLVRIFGIAGFPACGTPEQVLAFHRLDGRSIAGRVLESSL